MARTGLSKSQVRETRDQIVAEGRYPSVDAVRHALGTGSKSTIHKHLKDLAEEDSQSGQGLRRNDTARSITALVEQLTDRLHKDTDRRLRDLCAGYEEELEEKDREIAELRRTVARLGARLDQLEAGTRATDAQNQGFGDFSDLFASSRSGPRDDTPFNVILAGGRTMTIDFDSPQIHLTPRVFQG